MRGGPIWESDKSVDGFFVRGCPCVGKDNDTEYLSLHFLFPAVGWGAYNKARMACF
jgi:hypothetical protein